jgi:hypothetical protein
MIGRTLKNIIGCKESISQLFFSSDDPACHNQITKRGRVERSLMESPHEITMVLLGVVVSGDLVEGRVVRSVYGMRMTKLVCA